jgi:hypothetical protein
VRTRVTVLIAAAIVVGQTLAAVGRSAAAAPVTELLAGAREAFDNRHYAEADSLAGQARARLEAERHPDALQLAAALVAVARARAAQRSLADSVACRSARRALDLLAQAAQATPEQALLRADAHDVLALILDEQNRSDLALDHARRSLAIRRAQLGEIHEEVAEGLYRLGVAFLSLGREDSALAVMRAGLDVRLRLRLPRDRRIGDFHAEIATLLETQGDLDGARAELDATLREYEARLGPAHPAICQGLQRYCSFEYHNGEVALAVDLAQRAVAIAEASPGYNPVNLALLRGNLAVALSELGDFARARRVIGLAVPVYTERLGPNHRQTLWAEALLANADAEAGDTAAAVARYRSICERFENDPGITSTGSLTQARAGLAGILQDADPRAALAYAEAAEAAERARPDLNWMTVVEMEVRQLRLRSTLGDRPAVARLADRIERDLDERALRGSTVEAEALAARGEAAAREGRRDEAVRLTLGGSRIARAILIRNVRALADREGLALAGQRCGPLDALVDLAVAPGSGDATTAWDEVIRWRGLVAAEIARRRPPRGADVNAEVLRAHADWTAAERHLAMYEVREAGGLDAAVAARLADLRARADDAGRRWAAVAPRTVGGREPAEIGLASVRAARPPDAALVAFAAGRLRGGPERLIAFTVSRRGDVRALDLGPVVPIAASLARWRDVASRSPVGDPGAERACRAEGRRLRALTWDVIAPMLAGARDVYLVAEGPLHALPWGALPDGDRGYLVERAPTIHVLDAERELIVDDAPPAGVGLLALGGVDFAGEVSGGVEGTGLVAASTRAVLHDCADGRPLEFAPLPGTEREVEAIVREQAGEAQLLRGAAAGEAAFKACAPGKRLIHLATHAVVMEDRCGASPPGTRGVGGVAPVAGGSDRPGDEGPAPSPWLGRRVVLALAGANRAGEHDRDENEGLLTAEEVSTLDLQGAEWVVLSACESGVAEVWNREGLLGMTRAFHLAGARAVIASQWAVDDEATREWMTALYAARRHGATTAGAAMRHASCAILKSRRGDGRGTHPYYWAAFTASGD